MKFECIKKLIDEHRKKLLDDFAKGMPFVMRIPAACKLEALDELLEDLINMRRKEVLNKG